MKKKLLKQWLKLTFLSLMISLPLTSLKAQDAMLGEIRMFAGLYTPQGWLSCDGQVLPIAQYQALYSLLSTTYGGNGVTTFALPDLRGRAPIHTGTGNGLTYRPMGQALGTEQTVLNTNQLPAHNHTATVNSTNTSIKASSSVGTSSVAGQGGATTLASTGSGRTGGTVLYNNVTPDITLNTGDAAPAPTVTIGNTGQNAGVPIMQPALVVRFIIATEGYYPPRP